MKYAIILPDGAADEPVAALDGRTPLEAANTPNIDRVSSSGRQGIVKTVPDGYTPGSDIATLSLFGYDPRECHTGRAPLEAAAKGIEAKPGELIFRCNFVTLEGGNMADFTAGHISQAEADRLIEDLNALFADEPVTFHAGVSYRNLMVVHDMSAMTSASSNEKGDLVAIQPHDFPDEPIAKHMPRGKGAAWLTRMMERAREMLSSNDVSAVRADLGDNPVTDIWLWGQGGPTILEAFADRFGKRAACIAAVDLIKGIARSAGMTMIDVPGATGYLDTDYTGKGKAAASALAEVDVVIVHVEAPDEAGHLGDAGEKVLAIERVDEHVVGPVLAALSAFDEWRVLIAPDHPTPVERRVHTSAPPPFCMAGTRVQTVIGKAFSEKWALETGLVVDPGHELMEFFLKS